MEWAVEFTDEFGAWWDALSEPEQEDIDAKVQLLQQFGPALGRPHADTVKRLEASQHEGATDSARGAAIPAPLCVDPRRAAILLLGGDKTGDDRWYERMVPAADRLYDEHLAALKREGLI